MYFAFALLTDELDTLELVNRVGASRGMIGGNKLWTKKILSFKTVTPVGMYYMLNLGHHAIILSEIRLILFEARDKADAEEWVYKDTGRDIPEMGIRLSVPKIHRQDTTFFSGWLSFMQHLRKYLHLEFAVEEVDFIQDLGKRAKEPDLFTPRWVNNVRLSNASTFKTKPPDITKMSKYVLRHVNYHYSMICCGMVGVMGLYRQQPSYSFNNSLIQVGSMLLRHVMYHQMNLAEVYSLIAEVNQDSELDSVDIVVLDIPEAEDMVSMMNKQISVYL